MDTRQKALVLIVLLLGLGAGVALTTVENAPSQDPVAPEFDWTFFDKDGTVISDIHSATISGTVKFRAVLTNTPSVPVSKVTLGVFTSPAHELEGRWDFTEVSTGVYELDFDTTQVPDGEYFFDFQYLLEMGSVYLTVLSLDFDFTGGTGSPLDQLPDIDIPIVLGAGGIVAALALIVVFRRR